MSARLPAILHAQQNENHSNLASCDDAHDVGGAHDTIRQGVTAAWKEHGMSPDCANSSLTIDVVELALGDGVVDVEGREEEVSCSNRNRGIEHQASKLSAPFLAIW